MVGNPAVLGFHFLVELAALGAVGYWGWTANEGTQRWVWAIALPLLLGTVWAIFRVPGDGGEPIIEVPGAVRILIEWAVMGAAVSALVLAGQPGWGTLVLALVVLDYALQRERIARLLGR